MAGVLFVYTRTHWKRLVYLVKNGLYLAVGLFQMKVSQVSTSTYGPDRLSL